MLNQPKLQAASDSIYYNKANIMGTSRLATDKLFVTMNNITETTSTLFNVVRYRNILGSRSSVLPFFKKLTKTEKK